MEEQASNTEQQELSRALQLCLASLLFLAELRRAASALAAQAGDVLWASAFDGLALAADRLHAMRLRSDVSLGPAEEEKIPSALLDTLEVLAAEGATEVLAQKFLSDWLETAGPMLPETVPAEGPNLILKALKTLRNDRALDKLREERMKSEPSV